MACIYLGVDLNKNPDLADFSLFYLILNYAWLDSRGLLGIGRSIHDVKMT